jgi:hypothetical protein
MSILKNIKPETVLHLQDLVTVAPGQVVSKTLVQNKAVSLPCLHLPKARKSVHDSEGDALVTVFEALAASRLMALTTGSRRATAGDAGAPAACHSGRRRL